MQAYLQACMSSQLDARPINILTNQVRVKVISQCSGCKRISHPSRLLCPRLTLGQSFAAERFTFYSPCASRLHATHKAKQIITILKYQIWKAESGITIVFRQSPGACLLAWIDDLFPWPSHRLGRTHARSWSNMTNNRHLTRMLQAQLPCGHLLGIFIARPNWIGGLVRQFLHQMLEPTRSFICEPECVLFIGCRV